MTLAHGRTTVAIPGPSIVPDRVLNAMHRAAPNIYSGPIADLTARVKTNLGKVARSSGDALMYIGNGHAGWEASLSNVINPGDKLLALSTGRFTMGWVEMARAMGAEVDVLDFGTASPFDANKVEETLRADKTHSYIGVLAVHTQMRVGYGHEPWKPMLNTTRWLGRLKSTPAHVLVGDHLCTLNC